MKKVLLIVLLITQNIFTILPVHVRTQCVAFARRCLLPEGREIIDSMFFTPDQTFLAKQVMVGLIDAEQEKIQCALFRLTDHDITQALIDAHKRGVVVELLVDEGALGLEYHSTVSALESNGIDIYVYQPIELFNAQNNYGKRLQQDLVGVFSALKHRFSKSYMSIMHHKTFIFYNTIGGSVITSGSLNPTYAAFSGNEEMVSVRSNPIFVERWKKHFVKLQRRCTKRDYV